jgi:RimJ/RimL family protein N-acetyltransferase
MPPRIPSSSRPIVADVDHEGSTVCVRTIQGASLAPVTLVSRAAAPRLTTRRLVLRELRRTDFDAFAANLEPGIAGLGGADRRNAWRLFAASAGSWALDGIGWWAVDLADTNAFVGTCGVFHREAHPDRDTTAEDLEIGWSVLPSFRRQGFATEAAAAALAYGFETYRAPRVIAHIDTDNHASIRVSESIGMRYERDVSFYDLELRLYTSERLPA